MSFLVTPKRCARSLRALLVVVLLATSCSADSTTVVGADDVLQTDEATEAVSVEGDPDVEPEPTAEPTVETAPPPAAPEPTVAVEESDEFAGVFDQLVVGDCWNDAGNLAEGGTTIPSEAVPCDAEHEHEVFARTEAPYGPDSDYPDAQTLADELFADVCDPATVSFAGARWDVLPIQTWAFYPSEQDWDRGDRTVLCTVSSSLPDENPFKVGTAAAGSLVSDEAIVAWSTIAGQRDWFLSFQGSPLYPLTNGQFLIQNTSPQVLQTGFLFAAGPQEASEEPAQAFFFDFDDPSTVGSIDTGDLASWEISSPNLIVREPSTVFAARETDTDDWDIFRSASDTGAVQLTDNPGDDRWPTVTPDESGIVYSANGSIWIMNLDGSDPRQITDDAGSDFEVAVSPDGSRVVFASDRSGNDDIWLANIDGSGLRNLTDHPGADAWPFFSADGSMIYWQTDRLGVNSVIMVMTADGDEHSYFSFEFATNAAIMPVDVAASLAQSIPPIGSGDSPSYQVIEATDGADDGLGLFEHSSGRVDVQLPVGWQVAEVETETAAEFISSPNLEAFAETWAIDGVRFSLIAGARDDFEIAIQDAEAQTCDGGERVDTESAGPDGQPLELVTVEFTCGEASAWLVAVWNLESSVGLLLEAQFDSDPDTETDQALIIAISQNINWR